MADNETSKQAGLRSTRRVAMSAMLAPLAGLAAGKAMANTLSPQPGMAGKHIVLVHGASSGGWIWKMVAGHLRERGHEVWTPTLTGLGERAHLARCNVTMTTHIEDVVNCIKWEGLEDRGITLAGHSYAGSVLSGVAEKLSPATCDALVIIDGALPLDGQSHYSYFGREIEGLPELIPLGGNVGAQYEEPIRSWLRERMTPHPSGSFIEPLHLTGARERIRSKTFIKATGPGTVTFPHNTVERIRQDPTWRYEELPCGHNTPVEMPEETALAIERAAFS